MGLVQLGAVTLEFLLTVLQLKFSNTECLYCSGWMWGATLQNTDLAHSNQKLRL